MSRLNEIRRIDRLSALLLSVWLLAMISIPIQRWIWGEQAVLRGAVASVVLQAVMVLFLLRRVWTVRRVLSVSAGIVAFAWAVEWLGSSTGFPFGCYHYTGRLQPQLMGVPLLIPLAWLMMIPPSWAVAGRIAGGWSGWFVWISALAFTAWDMFLDPQMVHWGLWVWQRPGGYFGIPWMNFGGWLFAAILLTLAVRPDPIDDVALLLVYTLTWILESIALVAFWGLPGPGIVGFVFMGVFVVLGWSRSHSRES